MGSVVAGTSAVLGTGAVESARLENRKAQVQISQSDTNSQSAMFYFRDRDNQDEVDLTTDSKGRAVLKFKDMDGNNGQGPGSASVDLNHSGVFNFHSVFTLRNQGADDNYVWITLDNMPGGSDGGTGDNWIYVTEGAPNPNDATNPANKSTSNNKVLIPSGSTKGFGVHLDTRSGALSPGQTVNLKMTVHADESP